MNHYQVTVIYNNYFCKDELTPDLPSALSALAVYLEDPNTVAARIYDWEKDKSVLRWER